MTTPTNTPVVAVPPKQSNPANPKVEAKPQAEAKPVQPPASQPEPTETYVINGKEVQLTRTQAKTYIQKAGAVEDRMRAANELQQKAQSLIAEFEKDPEAVLQKLGKDPKKIFEQHLTKMAQEASLTPEQIEKQKLVWVPEKVAG